MLSPFLTASSRFWSALLASALFRDVRVLDRHDRAANFENLLELGPSRFVELCGLRLDNMRTVEEIAVLEEVGLVRENLLRA